MFDTPSKPHIQSLNSFDAVRLRASPLTALRLFRVFASQILLLSSSRSRSFIAFGYFMTFDPQMLIRPCTRARMQACSAAHGRLTALASYWSSPRPISSSQLRTLLHFHLCPIYLVVFKGVYSFDGITHLEGGFTLRCLQRLSRPDLATQLWGRSPTGAPAVSPSRSSRTKDSSSQISYARAG